MTSEPVPATNIVHTHTSKTPPLDGIDIAAEAELIRQKKSSLSKSQRDLVMAEYTKMNPPQVKEVKPEKKSLIKGILKHLTRKA